MKTEFNIAEFEEMFSNSQHKEIIEELAPNSGKKLPPRLFALLIKSHIAVGEHSIAAHTAELFHKGYPRNVTASLLLANLHLRHDKLDQALALIRASLKWSPDNLDLLICLARIFLKQNNVKLGIETLKKVVSGPAPVRLQGIARIACNSTASAEIIFALMNSCRNSTDKITLLENAAKTSQRNNSKINEYLFLLALTELKSENSLVEKRITNLESSIIVDSMTAGTYFLPPQEHIEKYFNNDGKSEPTLAALRKNCLRNPLDRQTREAYLKLLNSNNNYSNASLASLHHLLAMKLAGSTSGDNKSICISPIENVEFQGDNEILVKERRGSANTLFVFTGNAQQLGMPLTLFHNLFSHVDANIVYLRDRTGLAYTAGIQSLGSDVESTTQALAKVTDDLDSSRIFCFGNSSGGFGAMRYGKLLNAARICSICGPSTFNHLYNIHDGRGGELVRNIQEKSSDLDLDLVNLFAMSPNTTPTICYYGKDMPQDVWQAERFRDIPNIRTVAVDGVDYHWLILLLIQDGALEGILTDLISP